MSGADFVTRTVSEEWYKSLPLSFTVSSLLQSSLIQQPALQRCSSSFPFSPLLPLQPSPPPRLSRLVVVGAGVTAIPALFSAATLFRVRAIRVPVRFSGSWASFWGTSPPWLGLAAPPSLSLVSEDLAGTLVLQQWNRTISDLFCSSAHPVCCQNNAAGSIALPTLFLNLYN